MLEHYLDQLRSHDPEQRKQAILSLGRMRDPAALPALADIYRNDPEADVRDLALQAGRRIRQEMDGTAAPVQPVSSANTERAIGFLNQALDFHVRHNNVKALTALGQAFDANPNLRNDTMAVNLAADLTGLPPNEAARLMLSPDARRDFNAGGIPRTGGYAGDKPKRGQVYGGTAREEATWDKALLYLGIYALVNFGVTFLLTFFGSQLITTAMLSMSVNTPGAPTFQPEATAAVFTLPVALMYGLLSAVFSVVFLLVFDTGVHIIATTVMGGEGSMAGLIQKTTLFYALLVPISTVLSALPLAILASTSDPQQVGNILSSLSFLVSAIILAWTGKLVGEAYDFGTGRGCASIFLTVIAFGLLAVCCVVGYTTLVFQAMNGMIQ